MLPYGCSISFLVGADSISARFNIPINQNLKGDRSRHKSDLIKIRKQWLTYHSAGQLCHILNACFEIVPVPFDNKEYKAAYRKFKYSFSGYIVLIGQKTRYVCRLGDRKSYGTFNYASNHAVFAEHVKKLSLFAPKREKSFKLTPKCSRHTHGRCMKTHIFFQSMFDKSE